MESINTIKLRQEVSELCNESHNWQLKRPEYRDISIELFTEQMKLKYEYLNIHSSTLFEQCIKCEINMEQFKYMMNKLDEVNSGKDYNTASQEIGQKLVDVYVKPMIGEK
mgnify:FL=1